jgi:hypothetical protein
VTAVSPVGTVSAGFLEVWVSVAGKGSGDPGDDRGCEYPSGYGDNPCDPLACSGWDVGILLAEVEDRNDGVEGVDDGLEPRGPGADRVRRVRREIDSCDCEEEDEPDEGTRGPVSVAGCGILYMAPGFRRQVQPFPAVTLLSQQNGAGLLVVAEPAVAGGELLVRLGLVSGWISVELAEPLTFGKVRFQGRVGQLVKAELTGPRRRFPG